MAKELQRDLGLFAVVTISMGAMIGSGIFVLPGIAATIGGPAVILAYLLAGLIVLPAALSKAEMATAMPEAGGTYLYIDRSMGPLAGSIAGIGTWFSLSFKSAFALVGLGAYVLLFASVAPVMVKALALGIAGGLVLVNVLGAKQTGRLQAGIVTVVMVALVFFIANGMTRVSAPNFDPFFGKGLGGLLAATGFVFVSYAGVTKIASVAEEVEDPGRNIPLGMLISVLVMMLVYTLIVFVIVGVIPIAELGKTLTPMADAAAAFLGPVGVVGVTAIAALALTSMANAGVLSSSRYPFAMGRDDLAPEMMTKVSDRFRTPVNAIMVTGLLMMGLIAFVDVINLAKLASAFKILIFILVNVGLIAFREADLTWYDPEFTSPAYPWVQFGGIAGGLVLLTQMGWIPMLGAAGILAAGTAWYYLFAGGHAEREGAAVDAMRRRTGKQAVEQTRDAIWQESPHRLLLPLPDHVSPETEDPLLRVAASVVRARGGGVRVMEFEEVPDQVTLGAAAERETEEDVEFEEHTGQVAQELDIDVEVGEIVSHDAGRAVVNYVRRSGVDLVLMDIEDAEHASDRDMGWFMDHLPCDSIYVVNEGVEAAEEVLVVTDQGAYDPLKVAIANTVALDAGARLRFLQVLPDDAPDSRVESAQDYLDDVVDSTGAEAVAEVVRAEDRLGAAMERVRAADLVVLSAHEHRLLRKKLVQRIVEEIQAEGAPMALLVHAHEPRRRRFVSDVVDRVLYD